MGRLGWETRTRRNPGAWTRASTERGNKEPRAEPLGYQVANVIVVQVEVDRVDGILTLEVRVLAIDPVTEAPLNRRYLLA